MRVLVFDDKEINCRAAKEQLKKYDLTVVDSYFEAKQLLTPQRNCEKHKAIIQEQFGDFDPFECQDDLKVKEYRAASWLAQEQATSYADFDVVLADLLVPVEMGMGGTSKFLSHEMPLGIFMGLYAAVKGRAKYVAVFTDSDHHSHPASWCFDPFNHHENNPTAFTVEGCKVILSNSRNWIDYFDPRDLTKALEYEEYSGRTDVVRAKNWTQLLDHLLKG